MAQTHLLKNWMQSKIQPSAIHETHLKQSYLGILKIRGGQMQTKRNQEGLPWWRSGCESACQCRGHGFEPWPGKIPHAVEQLGP